MPLDKFGNSYDIRPVLGRQSASQEVKPASRDVGQQMLAHEPGVASASDVLRGIWEGSEWVNGELVDWRADGHHNEGGGESSDSA